MTLQTYKYYRREDKSARYCAARGCERVTKGSTGSILFGRFAVSDKTEKTVQEVVRHDVSYRFWHPADSLLAEPTRNKRPLFRRVIALPRTILISRLPIKVSSKATRRRSPNYMDHC